MGGGLRVRIGEFRFGMMLVDGRRYTRDLILLPDGRVVDDWRRVDGHLLRVEDLAALGDDVKVLVVGTGAHGAMRVSEEVRRWARERDVELVEADTAGAVREYNERAGVAGTAGAFHLTC